MIDYHVHTHHSVDAEDRLTTMIETAISLGVREIGLADHLDFDPRDQGYGALSGPSYLREGRAHALKRWGTIVVRVGVEVGEPQSHKPQVEAFLNQAPVDFVLGGLHWVGDHLVGTEEFFAAYPDPMGAYLREVRNMVDAGDFDALAHLDFPTRYMIAWGQTWDPRGDRSLVMEILDLILQKDMALEVNTAGFRRGLGRPHPPAEVLKWYRDMGGHLLTVGSDAHRKADLLSGVKESLIMLAEIGFDSLTGYAARQPYSITLSDLLKPEGA